MTPNGNSCCEVNTATCAGGTAPVCSAGTYYPSTSDSWKYKATNSNQNTACCTGVATCAQAKCGAGYKKKANVDTLSCTGDADTCGPKCCEVDKTKCGGLTGITCTYGTYDERMYWTADTKQATKDAWNNKAATEATKNT